MEAETRKILGPPRLIAAIVERSIPPAFREPVAGDLCENYDSLRRYLVSAVLGVPVIVADQVKRNFDWRFVGGQACLFYIAFAGESIAQVSMLITSVLLGVILRDAYLESGRRTHRDAGAYAAVGVTWILLSQVFVGLFAPSLALPENGLIRGAAFSLILMAVWRTAFFLKIEQGTVRGSKDLYRSMWRNHVLWAGAWVLLINTSMIPASQSVSRTNVVMSTIAVVAFALSKRIPLNPLDGVISAPRPLRLSAAARTQELEAQRDTLRALGDTPHYELLTFVLVAAPLVAACWKWISGDASVSLIDWTTVLRDFTALLALSALCIYIKRRSRRAAGLIQSEIDALAFEPKK